MIPISNKIRLLEITAVILTAVGKFVFINYLEWRLPFIVAAIIGWTIYIFYRYKTNPGIIKHWGFRTDNFTPVMKKVLPFGLISLLAFIGIGLYRDTMNITWHIIPILILYPIWGIIQQFLLIALTAGNMQDLGGNKVNKGMIILLSALLFAAVHYPFIWLIAGTFLLALFYALALTIAGLKFGLIIGLGAGLLSFIPYVGALVGGVVAIGVGLVQFWPDFTSILIVIGIFVAGQFIEGNFLSPKLVGSSIGLHPVWLMFALFAFGYVFGFVGLLLAVPLAAAAGVLARFALNQYLTSKLYRGIPRESPPPPKPSVRNRAK